jgi:hypothetical protein
VGAICRNPSDIATGLGRSFSPNCHAAFFSPRLRQMRCSCMEAVAKSRADRHFTTKSRACMARPIETGRRNAAGG